MAQTPGRHDQGAGPSLPDYSGQDEGDSGLPDFATGSSSQGPWGAADEQARSRSRGVIVAVVVSVVVLVAIVALVLSQTVFKGILDDDASQSPTAQETRPSQSGEEEYIPDPDDPELAPPPPIFTQKPTVDCYLPDAPTPAQPSSGGRQVRGGDLEYTRPEGWDRPWGSSSLPFLDEVDGYGRQVEGNWYSVVNLGRVDWPSSEGGYPGAEDAAVAIFQCYATTTGVLEGFGENPTVTDYRSEATQVDGHEAWIVQATYHFEDPDYLETSSASIVTSIVVETDDGPQALASDVAADVPEHAESLDEIIDSLTVVS